MSVVAARLRNMADWHEFSEQAPELASAVRARFEATKHHVLATLRADGSPRVSGTEVQFSGDDLTMGSMPQARKARDLQRDGRCALHANPGDGSMAAGDAKVSGTAVEIATKDSSHLFRIELSEAVLTTVEGDQLVITHWAPGRGVQRRQRS